MSLQANRDFISCSCFGLNPNCYKCWGSGIVDTQINPDSNQGTYLGLHSESHTQIFKTPNTKTTNAAVDTHSFSKPTHESSKKAASRKRKNKSNSESQQNGKSYQIAIRANDTDVDETKICVICSSPIENLYKHFLQTGHTPAKHKDKLSTTRQKNTSQSKRKGVKNTNKCLDCGLIFRGLARLCAHALNAHGPKALKKIKDYNPPCRIFEIRGP